MFDHSNLIVTAWKKDLVGVSRSITDWVWSCYHSDLAVRNDLKKKVLAENLLILQKKKSAINQ